MACQMACIDQRDIDISGAELPLRYVVLRETKDSAVYHSVGCTHCGACMEACPFGAMERDEMNLVQIVRDKCIGCGACVEACPLTLVTLTSEGTAKKCDGCAVRMENGLLPACVHTCPTGALFLVK